MKKELRKRGKAEMERTYICVSAILSQVLIFVFEVEQASPVEMKYYYSRFWVSAVLFVKI